MILFQERRQQIDANWEKDRRLLVALPYLTAPGSLDDIGALASVGRRRPVAIDA